METSKRPPIVEPVPIDDDLCTELAAIEDLRFGVRFVLVSAQTDFDLNEPVLTIRRKIVLPHLAIRSALDMTARFLSSRRPLGWRLRVVKD